MGRGMLFLVSGFVVIFGIIQMAMNDRQSVLMTRSNEYFYEEQSANIAASTMEIALAKLNDNILYPAAAQTDADGISILNGTGTIEVTDIDVFGTRVDLKITGIIEHGGKKTVTEIVAEANRYPFSRFAYFTDERSNLYWVTGDVINGPVHSNERINIWGDPVFNGKVTSPYKPYARNDPDPEFNKGYNWNAAHIQFPPEIRIVDKAKDGGLWYEKPIKVTFMENGNVKIKEKIGTTKECVEWKGNGNGNNSNNCEQWKTVPNFGNDRYFEMNEFNGIISSTGEVHVEGTLNGRITLHSQKDVIITGDIVYENTNFGGSEEEDQSIIDGLFGNDSEDKTISDDLLGIVSEGDVIVEEKAYTDSGKKDVTIHGSIFALGSFKVEDYQSDYFGYLYMVGGIIQNKDGITGAIYSNGSITGFNQKISYDIRLLKSSTNGFPRVDRFAVESWMETTKIKEL